MNRVADLRARGDRSVLVRSSAADVSIDDMRNYVKVVEMDPLIETYCQVYANDLEDRLGIKHDKLPAALSVTMLLNPMFGLKPKIVESGIMMEAQYSKARHALLYMIQDIMDARSPTPVVNCDSGSSSELDSEDEELPTQENNNFNLASAELILFENYKKKKYHPVIEESQSKVLSGLRDVRVGPVESCGSDLPSEKNLADYLDKRGRMCLLSFFSEH